MDEVAAPVDALTGVRVGLVEVVALIGHLRQPDVSNAGDRSVPSSVRGVLGEHLVVGPDRGVQATSRPLDLTEVVGSPGGPVVFVCGAPLCDVRGKGRLGLLHRAPQPRGGGQAPAGDQRQRRTLVVDLRERPGRERGRLVGVAAQVGHERPQERRHRVQISQRARDFVHRRLERDIRRGGGQPVGCGEQLLGVGDLPSVQARPSESGKQARRIDSGATTGDHVDGAITRGDRAGQAVRRRT